MTGEPRHPRFRWWFAGGLAVLLVAVVAVVAVVVTGNSGDEASADGCESGEYRLRDFDTPMRVVAVSPNGEYVLGNDWDDAEIVVWHDGESSTFEGPPEHGVVYQGVAIDDSGTVLGVSGAHAASWLYENGEFHVLEAPERDVQGVRAVAMNADGDVVGDMAIDDGEYGSKSVPLLWNAGEDRATRLEAPGGGSASVTAVADDGTVFGTADDRAWMWGPDGEGEALVERIESEAVNAKVFVDHLTRVTGTGGDWVVANGNPTVRIDIGDEYRTEELGKDLTATAVDEHGRVFGYDDKLNAVMVDDEPRVLPGLGDPPTRGEDELDGDVEESANRVVATSRDGSMVLGETGDDDAPVLWRVTRPWPTRTRTGQGLRKTSCVPMRRQTTCWCPSLTGSP